MKELYNSLRESLAFEAFMEKIHEKAKEWEGILRNSSDATAMYRAQGALNFYEYVRDLPDLLFLETDVDEKRQDDDNDYDY